MATWEGRTFTVTLSSLGEMDPDVFAARVQVGVKRRAESLGFSYARIELSPDLSSSTSRCAVINPVLVLLPLRAASWPFGRACPRTDRAKVFTGDG